MVWWLFSSDSFISFPSGVLYSLPFVIRQLSAESQIPSTWEATFLFLLLGPSCRELTLRRPGTAPCWPASLQALVHQRDCDGNSAWRVTREAPLHRASA